MSSQSSHLTKNEYKTCIKPKTGWLELNIREVFEYKDLIFMFVKRNFTTMYKQTVLGPLWLLLSPLISTLISTFVFGKIAGISSDGVPYFIFYMCGHTLWVYFAKCLTDTSATFTANSTIFGKVYFPRLVMPIATVITGLLNLVIQIVMLLCFWIYYYFSDASLVLRWQVVLTPLLIWQIALLGMGFGIIISSLTTKYRDLTVLVGFGVSLWMYITPIIYPASTLGGKLKVISMLNPVAPIIETFRYGVIGTGQLYTTYWGISWITTLAVLFIGVILFNRVEKTFMDTV